MKLKLAEIASKSYLSFLWIHLSETHFSAMTAINVRHRNSSAQTLFPVTNTSVNP